MRNSKIDRITNIVWKIFAYILAIMMFALVVIVFYQVFSRFILKDNSGWTQEIATDVFVWASFLGAALAIHSGDQICMTLVLNKTKRPVKQIIQIIAALICEIFYFFFMVAGFQATKKFANTTSAKLGLPMSISYLSIAVCGIVMLFFGIFEIVKPIYDLAKKQGQESHNQ